MLRVSYKQQQDHQLSSAAQKPGAICILYLAPENAQTFTHVTLGKKFAMLTATLLIARPSASVAKQTVKLQAASLVTGQQEEPGISHGFKPWESFSTLKPFSLEATRAASWDSEVDHLKFSYDGQDLVIPEGSLSTWYSPEKDVKVERVSGKNSAVITLKDKAEIMVTAVPVTKQDDKIHNYRVPANDCFVHLEVQFKFFHLSSKIDGVLGRTYKPDFENPAKLGVAMPVLGGENNYRIASLFSTDCNSCIFSPESGSNQETSPVMNYGTLDCTKGASAGYGIVCRK
ncbi:hypothetical protein OIU76_025565 [Salix suchowensis]|nr:hypothetical protein OIU76_025565 [Salix suchowensis]